MLGGTLAVGFCYLVLGWTKEIVGYFVQDAELVWYCSTPFDHVVMGADYLQQRQWAILLAVSNIYVLDFMINICMHSSPSLTLCDMSKLMICSSIYMQSARCRHTSHREAATWCGMGYDICLSNEFMTAWFCILIFPSEQNDWLWSSSGICDRRARPQCYVRQLPRRYTVQEGVSDCRLCYGRCARSKCLGCPGTSTGLRWV